jgi:hypothetical protein
MGHFLEQPSEFMSTKERKGVILTSIENKTPPMGEPKATATPAALAAVTISRILPGMTHTGQTCP